MRGSSRANSPRLDLEYQHYCEPTKSDLSIIRLIRIISTFSVLMQWAEGGSLDDFIDSRLGRRPKRSPTLRRVSSSLSPSHSRRQASPPPSSDLTNSEHSRSARIRAFRAFQKLSPSERKATREQKEEEKSRENEKEGRRRRMAERGRGVTTAVHLLSAEEVRSLFGDIVRGLGFLVSFF